MKLAASLLAGWLFGLGLAISGMLDPARVLGFLDVAGHWDPSLAFVLGGAVCVSAIGYAASRRMAAPAFAARFDIPTGRTLDAPLLAGSALFGVGWGLGGFCPGPAIASLALGAPRSLLFVASMLAGMMLHRYAGRLRVFAWS